MIYVRLHRNFNVLSEHSISTINIYTKVGYKNERFASTNYDDFNINSHLFKLHEYPIT